MNDVTASIVLPQGLPQMNLLLLFGTLGGLLAARVGWLQTITGFMALGLLLGPSGLGLLSPEALSGAKGLVDIALGLILFKLGAIVVSVGVAWVRIGTTSAVSPARCRLA